MHSLSAESLSLQVRNSIFPGCTFPFIFFPLSFYSCRCFIYPSVLRIHLYLQEGSVEEDVTLTNEANAAVNLNGLSSQ